MKCSPLAMPARAASLRRRPIAVCASVRRFAANCVKANIWRDAARKDLSSFIHGLVTEEFDGPEPSPAALGSIAAYVRALRPAACPKVATVPITLDGKFTDVEWAVSLAHKAYADADPATGRDLLAAARSTLGAIDERYQLAGLEGSRGELASASETLFRLQEDLSGAGWKQWQHEWPAHKRALRAAERQSLFNPAVLRKVVG